MSLRESARRAPRDRWPLEFDLAGVPREYDTREKLLRDEDTTTMEPNKFADGKTIDLNNVKVPYVHQDYPTTMYHADGRVLKIEDERAEKAASRKGFGTKPVEGYDYHLLRNGRAPKVSEPVELPVDDYADDDPDDQQKAAE